MTTPEQPEQGDSDIDAIKRGHVPVVDLEAAASGDPATRSDIAAEVGAACESLGFLVVTGHGVPSETVQELMTASWRYFNLPEDDKRRWMPPSPYVFRGYFPIQSSALAGSLDVETPPDLCEVFAVNRFDDPADAAAAGLQETRVLRHVAHVGRVLPPTQLRRRDHLYPHLHHRRRSSALRTSDVGTMGSRQTLKVRLLTQAAP